ncbi:MAG: ABC transporter substrate-binding protein [Candidatus Pacebacteria bacterium]|nr:ABC transporter substrate-binding protein [Candidatus Paceibacterota bacterium]
MKKVIITLIVLVCLLLVLSKYNEKYRINTNNQTVSSFKIGAALGLTGDASAWGEASRNAILLAQDEINAKGGIDGKKLEIVIEDMKSTSKDSVNAMSKLVNVDKVNAVMITWLDSYQGSESVVSENIPLISQDAAIESVNIPKNHKNVFSLWYRTSSKANVTIDEMIKSGVKTLYIVTQNDSYYSTLVQFLKKEVENRGIKIVGSEFMNSGSDVRTVISKVQSANPDAVFFGAYDEKLSVDFPKRWNELTKKDIALFADEFLEQSIQAKKVDAKWVEGAKYYVPSDPKADFVAKYKTRFGVEPMFSAINTYDTVYVLAKYLKDNPAPHTAEDLNAYMLSTKFDTQTYGPIKFDSIGGVVSSSTAIMMKEVRGGKLVSI